MESTIWMSYDLGVSGDYEGLYAWLDNHEAKECGNSVAWFRFSHGGDLLTSLKAEIEGAVSLNKRSRIYVVYIDDEGTKGRFIIGGRKGAPWHGHGMHEAVVDDQPSNRTLRAHDTVLLEDSPYRLDAYEDALERAKAQHHAMSLVDAVLCAILADPKVRIDAMLTFNNRDFGDICREREVALL